MINNEHYQSNSYKSSSIFGTHDATSLNVFFFNTIFMILFTNTGYNRHTWKDSRISLSIKKRKKKWSFFSYVNILINILIIKFNLYCIFVHTFYSFLFHFIFRFTINYKFFSITNESTIHNNNVHLVVLNQQISLFI